MAEAPETLAPDAIDGWPLPEAQNDWYGGSEVERLLVEAYRGGRMHHAWLIGGPKGIGKATLAYRFARFALTYPDPAPCTRCRDAGGVAGDGRGAEDRRRLASQHPHAVASL